MTGSERTNVHQTIEMLGMRAQANAAGLVQLCQELRASGSLSDSAIEHIKEAIAEQLTQYAPRSVTKDAYRSYVRERLNRVFGGREAIGPLPLNFGRDTDAPLK